MKAFGVSFEIANGPSLSHLVWVNCFMKSLRLAGVGKFTHKGSMLDLEPGFAVFHCADRGIT